MTAIAHQQPAGSALPGTDVAATKPKPDPRYLALRNFALSISVLNVFGYGLLGFEQPYLWPVFALLTAYTTEITLELISAWAYKRRPRFLGGGPRGVYEFLLPSHITALAVNMLLYANSRHWLSICCSTPTIRSCQSSSACSSESPASTFSRRLSTGGCDTS